MRHAVHWIGLVVALVAFSPVASAQHACDDLGDKGWRTVATVETVAQKDSAPYRADPSGSWYVERTVTLLPFCNFYNSVGNYSLRSYSLSPEDHKEQVQICRASENGGVEAVAPYAGKCPPR